jgi:hydroxymethylpyrimidine pyrophosphatase-like HAD family hydrolase/energy-coupling factor transporter ATP-binding protein EcfA2
MEAGPVRYLALAADYDGTLAKDGRVAPATVDALEQVAASGRRLVLVTGRELPQLLEIFPEIGLFDRVVAENGAVLYRPDAHETEVLAPPPSESLLLELQRRGVSPLSVGKCVVATVRPHESTVLEAIRDLGLELQVIFNKGAVMVLPPNVNKAYGLMAALGELGLSPHNVVAIGDAENDHALLQLAEYSAAVANAVSALKETADRTTAKAHGEGVTELIRDLVAHDLENAPPRIARRTILLGTRGGGERVSIAPAGENLLLAGSSGSGKSTLVTGILERLVEQRYQFCVVDPEGDYEEFPDAIVLGSVERPPSMPEILTALRKPDSNVVVDLVSLPLQDRPTFFLSLLPRLLELRAKTGRPHWIVVDETHHLLPADWKPARMILPEAFTSMLYVTVHPDSVAHAVLSTVGVLVVMGEAPESTIRKFCKAAGAPAPSLRKTKLAHGQALVWTLRGREEPFELQIAQSRITLRRHRRKYAEGELPPDRSFYFKGPGEKLNLRAHNLIMFVEIGDGVDDQTWVHHLRNGDYSQWIAAAIKDQTLAGQVREIELHTALSPSQSRQEIRAAIEERYTLPARAGGSGESKA